MYSRRSQGTNTPLTFSPYVLCVLNINTVSMTIYGLNVRVKGKIMQKKMWIGVDAMMLIYAMKHTKEIWRQQTQIPPIPQIGIWKYMDDWYKKHKFHINEQVLVLTLDSRVCPFKVARTCS